MSRRKTPYKLEEAKRIHDIIYEYFSKYGVVSVEKGMLEYQKKIKNENDINYIFYTVFKDLYEAGYR